MDGGHRSHVRVRDHEAGPLLGVERLEDAHHLVEIVADAAHHLGLRNVAERPSAVAGQLVHDGQPVRIGGAARPGDLERLEITLGGVDQVADDVADLPVRAGGRCLPGAWLLGHREHAFRFVADDPEDGVLPLVGHRVPRAHSGPSPCMSAPAGPDDQRWRTGPVAVPPGSHRPHDSSHHEPQRTTRPRVNAFQLFGAKWAEARAAAVLTGPGWHVH